MLPVYNGLTVQTKRKMKIVIVKTHLNTYGACIKSIVTSFEELLNKTLHWKK